MMEWIKCFLSESERLIINIGNKKFEGLLKIENNKASFEFNSLGIHKKIKLDSKENMKKEALSYLSKKAEIRIKELKEITELIKEELDE